MNWIVLAEAPDSLTTWVKDLGFPIAICLVLLYAIWKGAEVVLSMLQKRNDEALAREQLLSSRLNTVETEFRGFMNTTAKESASAMNRVADAANRMIESDQETRTVLLSTQNTLDSNRKMIEEFKKQYGSSASNSAVKSH